MALWSGKTDSISMAFLIHEWKLSMTFNYPSFLPRACFSSTTWTGQDAIA